MLLIFSCWRVDVCRNWYWLYNSDFSCTGSNRNVGNWFVFPFENWKQFLQGLPLIGGQVYTSEKNEHCLRIDWPLCVPCMAHTKAGCVHLCMLLQVISISGLCRWFSRICQATAMQLFAMVHALSQLQIVCRIHHGNRIIAIHYTLKYRESSSIGWLCLHPFLFFGRLLGVTTAQNLVIDLKNSIVSPLPLVNPLVTFSLPN